MIKHFFSIIFLLLFSINSHAEQQFYVSAKATANGDGTANRPFSSIQEAINKIIDKQNQKVCINVLPGEYFISEPITINRPPKYPITIKGIGSKASQIIGGIKIINNWHPYRNGIYCTKINLEENKSLEQLYVNDRIASLAHTPNDGYISVQDIDSMTMFFNNKKLKDIYGLSSEQFKKLRFEFYEKWDIMNWIPSTIEKDKGKIVFYAGQMKKWNQIKKGTRCIIYNSPKSIDSPNEWYYDSNKKLLFYYPLKGESINSSVFFVPITKQLIRITGKPEKHIKNIEFQNLEFKCSAHYTPENGEGPEQAACYLDAAIDLNFADNITFHNCYIRQIGEYAFSIGQECHNNTISHCLISDIGAGGIKIGLTYFHKGNDETSNIIIDNNIIRRLGRIHPDGVGILLRQASNCKITHNEINDLFYSGISAGWTWGYNDDQKTSGCINNTISYNHIHNIGKGVMSDMGGIYTLGESKGTSITNNIIHNVVCAEYGGSGIYADEGSSHILIKNNLVYDCSSDLFHEHYGYDNLITNNIFAFGGECQLYLGRNTRDVSFNICNNIIIQDKGLTISDTPAWPDIHMVAIDNNIYYYPNGKLLFGKYDFNNWKSFHDKHSIEADPMFADAPKRNFKFKDLTNADKISFKPFDYFQAGVYGSYEWVNEAKK